MNLTCAIIDDEPNAVNLLEMLITQSTDWKIVLKVYDGLEAISFFKTGSANLVFLDINMPNLNGMELASLLPGETAIIFTTAYSKYAFESYNFNTIDYLLKPITLPRFLAATRKVEEHFMKRPAIQSSALDKNEDFFFAKSGREIHKVLLNEILYFEGEKEYVRLVTSNMQILVYRRMKDIEAQLGAPFIRVHNSFIVNIRQLNKIQDNHILIGNKKIPISDKFREGLQSMIERNSL